MISTETLRETDEKPDINDGLENIDIVMPEGQIITEQLRVRLAQQGGYIVGLLKIEKNHKRFDIILDIPKDAGGQTRREVTSGNFEVIHGGEIKPMRVTPARIPHPQTDCELVVLRAEEADKKYQNFGYYEI